MLDCTSLPPYQDTELNEKVPNLIAVSKYILTQLANEDAPQKKETLSTEINDFLTLLRDVRIRIHQVLSFSRNTLNSLINEERSDENKQLIIDFNQHLTELIELQRELIDIHKEIRDKVFIIGIDIL
ncbi:hypothetical protein JW911_02600 [Candidatus Peregrinibacteria bacterium]|nr:hypothetical protein [Candidatus Peregrinibacteria bacterium]